jgi:hypothetical protein
MRQSVNAAPALGTSGVLWRPSNTTFSCEWDSACAALVSCNVLFHCARVPTDLLTYLMPFCPSDRAARWAA